MPYVVYEDATRHITGVYADRTAANTIATAVPGWSAYPTEVTGADRNHSAEPGWSITAAGAVQAEPILTKDQKVAAFLKRLRIAAVVFDDGMRAH